MPDWRNMSTEDIENYSGPLTEPEEQARLAELDARDNNDTYGDAIKEWAKSGGLHPGSPPPIP